MPRHRHDHSYLSLVISGGYEETGDRGRLRVEAGDILLHGAYDAHLNRFAARDAEILNITLPEGYEPAAPLMRTRDIDAVVRLAARSPAEAAALLLAEAEVAHGRDGDWPERLATALSDDPHLRLADWAEANGLATATVSRGFKQVFGVSPIAFRAQVRARQAWRRLRTGASALADLAFELGFADQAHMTRAVRAMTGLPPSAWRPKVK
jgi:AraC-like DNA-binding protein